MTGTRHLVRKRERGHIGPLEQAAVQEGNPGSLIPGRRAFGQGLRQGLVEEGLEHRLVEAVSSGAFELSVLAGQPVRPVLEEALALEEVAEEDLRDDPQRYAIGSAPHIDAIANSGVVLGRRPHRSKNRRVVDGQLLVEAARDALDVEGLIDPRL